MKRVYDAPAMEIIRLEEKDIIATSNQEVTGGTFTLGSDGGWTYSESDG